MAADPTLGVVQVTTANQGLASANTPATMQAVSPGFLISASNYVAAEHGNASIVGPTTLFQNNSDSCGSG